MDLVIAGHVCNVLHFNLAANNKGAGLIFFKLSGQIDFAMLIIFAVNF